MTSPTPDEGHEEVSSAEQPAVDGAQQDMGSTSPLGGQEPAEPLRSRLVELAAAALAEMRPTDIPAQLRPVVGFAAVKRAKLGGSALLSALRDSTVFRTAVVDWCRANRPAALELDGADPVVVAAAAVLRGASSASHYVELLGHRAERGRLRSECDSATARAQRLESEAARLRADLAEAKREAERAGEHGNADAERMRKRLREQGVHLKESREEAASARAETDRIRRESDAALVEATARCERERSRAEQERGRADRAAREAESARHAAREARQGDETRLALLLDTLEGSVAGLRQELAPSGRGPRPAEAVPGARANSATTGRIVDAAGLDRVLALPVVHLVVDGYNVTKTGYPELTLADQRDRLSHQLASLAARSGAEVTVVFDGADVVAVPNAGPRGVRVLFSEPGVQADDVIRELVDAEPRGRQVIVATADRAVVESVRVRGAYAVESRILLERIGPA